MRKPPATETLWMTWKTLFLAAGTIPNKKQFHPMQMGADLASIYVAERRDGIWYKRLMGQGISESFGSVQTDEPFLTAYWEGDSLDFVEIIFEHLFEYSALCFTQLGYFTNHDRWTRWNYLLVPFMAVSASGPLIFVAGHPQDQLEPFETPLSKPVQQKAFSAIFFDPLGKMDPITETLVAKCAPHTDIVDVISDREAFEQIVRAGTVPART